MSNFSKAERKENRIQQLEKELSEQKRNNVELQKNRTIRLDEKQVEQILESLTQCVELSTDRIVDESPKIIVESSNKKVSQDGFSFIIKWTIAITFFVTAFALGYLLYNVWGDFWNVGLVNRTCLFVVAFVGFNCFVLGVGIIREKDRNYIISLFSALVALVALVITLIK